MLPLLLLPVLVGVSMLAQRPVSRVLSVQGPVWPLVPLAPAVPWKHRLAVRGAGVAFTFALVLGALSFQYLREQRLTTKVKVAANSAASEAGLQTNDRILAVDGVAVDDFGALRDQLQLGGPSKRLTALRDGVTVQHTATLRDGVLGVQASGEERPTRASEAVASAATMLVTFPVKYVRATWRTAAAQAEGAPSATVASVGNRWVFALAFSLVFSWWLQLGVELGALGLGLLAQRGQTSPAGLQR